MKLRQTLLPLLLLILFVGLIVSGPLVHLLTEVWWFEAVGFEPVFWTRVVWKAAIGAIAFVAYLLFLWGNYRVAVNLTRDRRWNWSWRRSLTYNDPSFEIYAQALPKYIAGIAIFLLAASAAAGAASQWETVLQFFNASEFGTTDPIFRQDIGFYFFKLPFYQGIQSGLLVLAILGGVLAIAVYLFKGAISWGNNWHQVVARPVKLHLSLLIAAIALLAALGFWLDRYQLLYSTEGVLFGAGYTDVSARLQARIVMSLATLALAIFAIASARRRGITALSWAIFAYFSLWLTIDAAYPWFQQKFAVEPNELVKERPYITYNIEATRQAYGLEAVQTQNYPVTTTLNRQDLQANQSTIRNLRLWDYRPLLSTYRQLQEIRLYYSFRDVDIDRYDLNGDYRQVMLSARELAFSQVPDQAKTWVNQRLKYTHGYGLVMSPVNKVTPGGLPELWIKDIPPTASIDLPLAQPAIYYGEETDSYIFTGTSTDEFDYPQGNENALVRYSGKGGVAMGSLWRRLAYAYDFSNFKILISNYFTNTSRIHYHRTIGDRVRRIAPFLQFDSDPYIAVIDGKLQWIIDAYTTSDRYPYSEPVSQSNGSEVFLDRDNLRDIVRGNTNYIRNSVKAVVDAYDGSVRLFAVDESDPILQTYRKIFPTLFESPEAIPPTLNAHFRYPLDLFKIQMQIYLSYHMSNPEVFYNREDLWRFPLESYEGQQQIMEPYYAIVRLPGQEREEFILILPFTPANKDNMIAWMAARSDGEDYGKLLLYEFSKQELVYGPSQIEARIDQNPEISQQLTLWSQEGSRVIRGDLLVIPINTSLLYVEPIYLRAEQGELPELKRTIVAYGNQTVMAADLESAIAEIFGEQQTPQTSQPVAGNVPTLVRSALETYQKAQEALRQGNWQQYGRYQQELGNLLQQLNQTEKN